MAKQTLFVQEPDCLNYDDAIDRGVKRGMEYFDVHESQLEVSVKAVKIYNVYRCDITVTLKEREDEQGDTPDDDQGEGEMEPRIFPLHQ